MNRKPISEEVKRRLYAESRKSKKVISFYFLIGITADENSLAVFCMVKQLPLLKSYFYP